MRSALRSGLVQLIGRGRDVADVEERLTEGRRLVTVIGPGGVGKTALSTAVLERRRHDYPLGGHRVDLSRIDRPDAVAGALAGQLGFSSSAVICGPR